MIKKKLWDYLSKKIAERCQSGRVNARLNDTVGQADRVAVAVHTSKL